MSGDPGGGLAERMEAEEGSGRLVLPAFVLDPRGVATRRWRWMAGVLVAGLCLTAAASLLWSPSYTAKGTILIRSRQIPEDFVRSTVREDPIAYLEAMVATILSREALLEIVNQFELYPDLRGEGSQLHRVSRMRPAIEVAPLERPRGRQASVIYEVSFESEDPETAAEVTNALLELFVEASIERRTAQARRTTEFLRSELARDEKELREQANRTSEFRRANRGALPSEQTTNLRRLELLEQQRESIFARIDQKQNQIGGLSGTREQDMSPNERLLQDLRGQLARELASSTEKHPSVVALRRQIERQAAIVAEEPGGGEARAAAVARRAELDALREELRRTEASIEMIDERIERSPMVSQQLAELEQAEVVLREDYLNTLRNVEDAELAESLESASQGAQVSILDRATVPTLADVPAWLVMLGGLAATLGLALGIAILLELLDPVVVSKTQLERLVPIPVLGSLPGRL